VAVVVLVRTSGCLSFEDPNSYVKDEAAKLRTQIERPGMEPLGDAQVERSAWSATMRWQYRTHEDWAVYSKELADALSSDFKIRFPSKSRIELTRELQGDTHHIVIELVSSSPPQVIRVTFTTKAE
jgi:hypothetical protein